MITQTNIFLNLKDLFLFYLNVVIKMKAMANFILQVTCAWVLMCVPGLIVVSSHLFFGEIFDTEPIDKNKDSKKANIADITCYEDTKEYFPIVRSSRFWIEGMDFFSNIFHPRYK